MLKTVHVSYSLGEALATASSLEAAGLVCHVAAAEICRQSFMHLVAFGGLEIQVPTSEVETARALIAQANAAPSDARLETETQALRRRFFSLGLVGLLLSMWSGVPFPVWSRARRWLVAPAGASVR
ncbi:hypothetical protein [Consotaella aegiceratis]|uniref:hypothetical protein n=1 Tax=Consotaella aegiceratis TaxID=3097961 RepID=UPI002F414C4A